MSNEYIEEYLVSLGWDYDSHGAANIRKSHDEVEKTVSKSTTNVGKGIDKLKKLMVDSIGDTTSATELLSAVGSTSLVAFSGGVVDIGKKLVEMQIAAVGAFVAMSGGVVAFIGHTADADLATKTIAARMNTTIPIARAWNETLSELHTTPEEMMVNPEIMARAQDLMKQKLALEKSNLGPKFEADMKAWRDLEFEVTKAESTLGKLGQSFAGKMVEALGGGPGVIEGKLQHFENYVEEHMPQITQAIATDVLPILESTWKTLENVGEAAKGAASIFQLMIGVLSGDDSLKDTPVTFDSISKSVQHTINFIDDFIYVVTQAEKGLAGLIKTAYYAYEVAQDIEFNKPVSADWEKFKAAGIDVAAATSATGDGKPDANGNPDSVYAFFHKGSEPIASWKKPSGSSQVKDGDDSVSHNRQLIVDTAASLGIDPRTAMLALAVAQTESGTHQLDKHGNVVMAQSPDSHATGMFQLQPATAKEVAKLHHMTLDPTDRDQNIKLGELHLDDLLKKYHGNTELAIEAYFAGGGAVDSALHGRGLRADAYTYEQNVAHNAQQIQQTVSINGTQIHINQPGASPDDINHYVHAAMTDATRGTLMPAQGTHS